MLDILLWAASVDRRTQTWDDTSRGIDIVADQTRRRTLLDVDLDVTARARDNANAPMINVTCRHHGLTTVRQNRQGFWWHM